MYPPQRGMFASGGATRKSIKRDAALLPCASPPVCMDGRRTSKRTTSTRYDVWAGRNQWPNKLACSLHGAWTHPLGKPWYVNTSEHTSAYLLGHTVLVLPPVQPPTCREPSPLPFPACGGHVLSAERFLLWTHNYRSSRRFRRRPSKIKEKCNVETSLPLYRRWDGAPNGDTDGLVAALRTMARHFSE